MTASASLPLATPRPCAHTCAALPAPLLAPLAPVADALVAAEPPVPRKDWPPWRSAPQMSHLGVHGWVHRGRQAGRRARGWPLARQSRGGNCQERATTKRRMLAILLFLPGALLTSKVKWEREHSAGRGTFWGVGDSRYSRCSADLVVIGKAKGNDEGEIEYRR